MELLCASSIYNENTDNNETTKIKTDVLLSPSPPPLSLFFHSLKVVSYNETILNTCHLFICSLLILFTLSGAPTAFCMPHFCCCLSSFFQSHRQFTISHIVCVRHLNNKINMCPAHITIILSFFLSYWIDGKELLTSIDFYYWIDMRTFTFCICRNECQCNHNVQPFEWVFCLHKLCVNRK